MLILVFQLAVLVMFAVAVALWVFYFPNPSPLIKPFLKPQLRWPEKQIRQWLSAGRIDQGYLRFFNRDPHRKPPLESGLVAPADGLVTSVMARDGIRYVVIALTFWDVHVQRCPADGEVRSISRTGDTFTDGEGRDFAFLREKRCPVQSRIEFDTNAYGTVAVRLITSLAARRIEVWTNTNNVVRRGDRLGRILLGSTVVLEIDEHLQLQVQRGQRVVAGETLVASNP